MALIYQDNEPRSGGMLNVHAMNPHKPYATHVGNWYYLKFILTNSTDYTEKRQAQKELGICERKLRFWYRHPSFDVVEGARLTKEAQAKWNSSFAPSPNLKSSQRLSS